MQRDPVRNRRTNLCYQVLQVRSHDLSLMVVPQIIPEELLHLPPRQVPFLSDIREVKEHLEA